MRDAECVAIHQVGFQSLPSRVAAAMGGRGKGAPVQFVVEDADWAIRWVGEGIRDGLPEEARGKVATTLAPQRLIHRVAHFGSQYMWVDWAPHLSRTNQPVVSFFHGKPEDGPAVEAHIERFLKTEPQLRRIVTFGQDRSRAIDELGRARRQNRSYSNRDRRGDVCAADSGTTRGSPVRAWGFRKMRS